MQGSLPGTEPIDLLGSEVRQNEVDFEGVGVHAYGNSDKLVLFLCSQKDELIDLVVDLSDLFLEFSAIEIDYLGVREGENPGSNRSTAEVNSLDEAAISDVFNDGELSVHLDSHEIMRVVVHNPVWSVELDQFWSRNGDTPGDKTIFGGEGADTIDGGTGNDHLDGGDGDDALYGGDGADTLIGGEGNDRLIGGESKADVRDVIYAGDGNDFVVGGYGNDELRGDEGNDTIEGGFGADTLIGGDGDDVLAGSAWSDEISGGGGDDFVHGGFGNDRVNGGAGGDRFFHVGIIDHGSDWVQDYDASEGDVLVFGNTSATADQFQVNFTETDNAGEAGVEEAFIIYRPTGQIMWALVDGEAQDEIMLRSLAWNTIS
jgi:Ca2+-binding RTX toxin-like protein